MDNIMLWNDRVLDKISDSMNDVVLHSQTSSMKVMKQMFIIVFGRNINFLLATKFKQWGRLINPSFICFDYSMDGFGYKRYSPFHKELLHLVFGLGIIALSMKITTVFLKTMSSIMSVWQACFNIIEKLKA